MFTARQQRILAHLRNGAKLYEWRPLQYKVAYTTSPYFEMVTSATFHSLRRKNGISRTSRDNRVWIITAEARTIPLPEVSVEPYKDGGRKEVSIFS